MSKYCYQWLVVFCLQGCISGGNTASSQTLADSLIVLVDIKAYGAEEIAAALQVIEDQKPSVVAIDKALPHFVKSKSDSLLATAISRLQRVVLLSEIDSTGHVVMPHENYIYSHHRQGVNSVSVEDDDFVLNYVPLYETDSFPTMQLLNFAEQIVASHSPEEYDGFDSIILNKETAIRFLIEPTGFQQCDLRNISSYPLLNKILILGDLRDEQNVFNVVINGKVHKTNPTVVYAYIVLNRFKSMSTK